MREFSIPIRADSGVPLYQQIYEGIRIAILDGKIGKGERLPSTRSQSAYLEVSRSTVQLAYDQLLAEGYIYSEPYRGYFVCDVGDLYSFPADGSFFLQAEGKDPQSLSPEEPPEGGAGGGGKKAEGGIIDFSPDGIDTEEFPYAPFGKILRDLILDERGQILEGSPPFGDERLRALICAYLYRSRGVNCCPEQIVLGAGNEYLQILLSQIFGDGRCAAMESPTYLQAYRTFRNLGYPVREIAVDVSGMRADRLRESGADLAYVMPSHQFPLGIVMPLKRRLELLAWAAEDADHYLIEDDYDSEFRYRGKPVPSLQGMDRNGKVIYLGTFSRSIAPSLRVSYMVLPKPLLEICRTRCGFYSCTVSNIMQKALCEFMESGLFEKNRNRMKRSYRARHDHLLAELRQCPWAGEIYGENAGLHLLAEVNTSLSEEELSARCLEKGVRVRGISEYYIERKSSFRKPVLLLGYGGLETSEIDEGLRRIGETLRAPAAVFEKDS